MRVLLINPWDRDVFPPPSLGYLQSVIRHREVEVKACNLPEALLEKDEWDIVGVTFHSFSVRQARRIREHFKGHLICGGHHPSALPEQMLSIGYDQVVIGEGENAMIDILQGNRDKVLFSAALEGKYYNGIDALPFPDYTGLMFKKEIYGVPIISSRGCPYDCGFCASKNFWGRKWRKRSAGDVLDEVYRNLLKGETVFMFEDDNFTLDKQRAIDICKGIMKFGKFRWQCASRAESLDDELCQALSRVGCKTVWLGVESFSQPSLDRCKKNTTVEKMVQGIKIASKHGIEAMAQFIVGIPGDTEKDILETVRVIRQNKIQRRGCNVMWILPGTDVYDCAKAKGFSDDTYLNGGSLYYTYEQTLDTLNRWEQLIRTA